MKITPLDIQQQRFRVKFRGFDMVEVDEFLDLLAGEFEELVKENNQLREEDRRKMARINEMEAADKELREAIISIQRVGEDVKKNAYKEAELIIEEAKGNARKIIDATQNQALKIEAEIQQLKRQRTQFEASLKATIDIHQRMIQGYEEEPGDSLKPEGK